MNTSSSSPLLPVNLAGRSGLASTSTTGNIITTPKPPTHVHPRSCTFCRHRKVKCDRQQPCSNCLKAEHGAECIYPPGPGRAAKRSRRPLDSQLVDRLSRLETIIRHLNTDTSASPPLGIDERLSAVENASPLPSSSSDYSSSTDQQLGRLVIDETRSYYISNVLWANLGNEIEELRNMLAEPASEEEDHISDNSSSAPLGSNAAIMGFRALAYSLQSYHPPLPESVALLRVFAENVAPLVHIFHMPTITRIYWDAIASVESIDKNTEALLFAIYYSAVISLGQEQCITILGISREAALEKYRFAVEQALARANLLNTQSMILLQAAVLFITALRNEDDSRTVWSLTSLVFHIAQAMGLHRDGAAFGLKPFKTEMRRRLWYHICLLDSRSSEYHGYEPIVHEFVFDTKLPLHINDSDITPEMTTPPPERDEACEMTFCLIGCEAMRMRWKANYAPPSMRFPGRPADELSLKDRQALVEELKGRLQERYLKHCDTNVPVLLLSSAVARLIIARTWLVVHYPLGRSSSPQSVDFDSSMRDKLFLTSIEVLELSSMILTNKDMAKWIWHSKTHIQWHAVAFVLSEICSRPPSTDCDRAWEYICTVYDAWKIKENEKKGTLWRPIKRLMAKARYVREMQKLSDLGERSGFHETDLPFAHTSHENIPSALSSGSSEYIPPVDSPFGGVAMHDMQSVLGMESLDPFMQLFPDDLGVNIFSTMQGYDTQFT